MATMIHNPADLTPVLDILGEMDDTDILEFLALIEAVTTGLPTLAETGDTITTDGTEQNVYINDTPLGVFRPICVKIDFTNHTAAETVKLRVYYRIRVVGPYVLQDETSYAGLVSPELIDISLEPNRFGVKVTIEKTAGANRDYDWEAFYKI